MALALTCGCGARFELDDTLAGQTVTCPECQQSLKAPALRTLPPRTSGLALASVVLALIGAFSGIGSAVAAVLGGMALARIARQRDRLAGAGLALFGLIAGIVFTGLFVFAVINPEMLGMVKALRQQALAGQVDTTGRLEHVDAGKGFSITRPSKEWGVVPSKTIEDPLLKPLLHQDADLLLVQTARYVFIDVRSHTLNNARDLMHEQQNVLSEFKPEPFDLRLPRGLADPDNEGLHPTDYVVKTWRDLGEKDGVPDGVVARELQVEVTCGQRWHFLIRLYLSKGKLYVVRAFAQGARRFKAARPELDKALDSFELTDRRGRPKGGQVATCAFHPERPGVGVCVRCRRAICAGCCTRLDGVNHCHACLKKLGSRPDEARRTFDVWPLLSGLLLALSCLALAGLGWLLCGSLAP